MATVLFIYMGIVGVHDYTNNHGRVVSLASYSLIDRVIVGVLSGIVYGGVTAGIMGLVRYFKKRPK